MNKKETRPVLGTMIDCSRNGVMNISSLKRWIDLMADMDYNTVMLYMEDTYEVKDNPYFGYARGGYSLNELKEIDTYAKEKDIEIIPCIQTLAHLNAIVNWPAYRPIVDCDDILLVGDERTYELVDNMFASLAEALTTRRINIGMDEAHMICRGRYYDQHGDCDRTKVLVDHIIRVSEIGKKYGFTLSMWSDMFFRIASKGQYYNADFEVSDDIKALIPDNVELVYWDYYSTDKKHYDDMLKAHNKLKEGTWFAGGAWTWRGFAPNNKFSIEATKAALYGCKKNNITNIFFTMWGDDSGECSKFACIPALFYISEYIKGNKNTKSIKEKFKLKFGISFDRFMLLDLADKGRCVNPSKYVLYNDLFNGLMDKHITDNLGDEHKALSRKLTLLRNDENWGYLFDTMKALCDVVALKADLGIRIRKAYDVRNTDELKIIISDCKKLKKLMETFYTCYEKQWMKENKAVGFDVQDIRIGGMIARVAHCTKRLEKFVNGEISHIDELDNLQLDYFGNGTNYEKKDTTVNSFEKIFTANILSW